MLTVRDIIKKEESSSISESVDFNIKLEGSSAQLNECEKKVLVALNLGVIVEGVLNERRTSRNNNSSI